MSEFFWLLTFSINVTAPLRMALLELVSHRARSAYYHPTYLCHPGLKGANISEFPSRRIQHLGIEVRSSRQVSLRSEHSQLLCPKIPRPENVGRTDARNARVVNCEPPFGQSIRSGYFTRSSGPARLNSSLTVEHFSRLRSDYLGRVLTFDATDVRVASDRRPIRFIVTRDEDILRSV